MHIDITELEFLSPKILTKIQKRTEKKLRWKKYAQMNHWASLLFKEAFIQKRALPHLIKKVHPLIGYGVFTINAIPELTYVGEYVGEVRKRRWWQDGFNDYIFGYVIGPHDTPWVIDAKGKGNFTRFINHSDEPNLTSRWLIVDNITHIIFFANRLIQPGEQLTYDYGPTYWRKRPLPQLL